MFVLISFILWRKMPGLSAVNCLSSIAACFLPVAIATTSRNLYCIATFKQLVSRLQKRWVATSNCVCHLSYAQQASRNYYILAIYTLQKLARRSSDRLHAGGIERLITINYFLVTRIHFPIAICTVHLANYLAIYL